MLERVREILSRLAEYSAIEVAVELAVLCVCVYLVLRFVRGTRAAGALKGLLLIIVVTTITVRVIGQGDAFARLTVLYDKFLGLAAIVLIVTFQPELRRALIRLGEAPFFRGSQTEVRPVVDAVVSACSFLSKSKFGAIIAIERQVGLRETIETGRALNADISSHLLNAIFWPNGPLHDMGVVIRGRKIVAACVQFPLAEPGEVKEQHFGTRHRAALGLARVSDAVIVVVSEETGAISLAEGNTFLRWLTPESLEQELSKRLARGFDPESAEAEEAELAETAILMPDPPTQSAKKVKEGTGG